MPLAKTIELVRALKSHRSVGGNMAPVLEMPASVRLVMRRRKGPGHLDAAAAAVTTVPVAISASNAVISACSVGSSNGWPSSWAARPR